MVESLTRVCRICRSHELSSKPTGLGKGGCAFAIIRPSEVYKFYHAEPRTKNFVVIFYNFHAGFDKIKFMHIRMSRPKRLMVYLLVIAHNFCNNVFVDKLHCF